MIDSGGMIRPLLLLLILSCLAFSTSVVGVRTPIAIVIGADSKLGRGDAPGSLGNGGCKIGVANKVVWGYAGTLSVDGTDFSLDRAARRFMAHKGTLTERVKEFEDWVVVQLTDIIPRLEKGDPKYFSEHIDGRNFSEIVFAANDRGILRMSKRTFVCYQGCAGKISVVPDEFPGPKHPESGWTALGEYEGVNNAMKANPKLFDHGLEFGIRNLIQGQIDTHPVDTGPPIAVVRIQKNTIRWVDPGACSDQGKNKKK